MNVLLLSQCDKRALTETRRILDQFAERCGDRTWQTPITQDGLDTLRRLLRKTARKNTAVSCHWIRGLDHSELLWVVGDAGRFNAQGAVPTNTTTRNVLRKEGENDWHTGEDIHLLTALAALLHDLGKASASFQARLRNRGPLERNLYRHEWVSLRLFAAFVGKDDDAAWLKRLAAPTAQDDASWLLKGRLLRDGLDPAPPPFPTLPPLAQAVGWLVLTHHRLPVMPASEDGRPKWLGAKVPGFSVANLSNVLSYVDASWNEQCTETGQHRIEPYWQFPHELPVATEAWRKRAARLALRLLKLIETPGKGEGIANPYVMHVSRLALMLADHHYSSLTDPRSAQRVTVPKGYPLFANTDRATGALNQTLDEHLIGVAQHSAEICHALPDFERHLPRIARHKGLKKRNEDPRFRWQDKAADTATAMRAAGAAGGAFIVNMASTGCGKTLANARIMYALADPTHGMRCTFALGLRTLTLQTGRVYRDALNLRDDDLAIRVGGTASRQLFEHYEALAERSGSASVQDLVTEDSHVHFDGNIDAHPLLQKAMHDLNVRKLLAAPVLACTIDHLTPATESQRGGRQIAPMLRLMSADLVLDELDDFDIDDLPAVARLVHWAGMLGARVLISSATLPPALVQGMFDAYRDGRSLYARNRGERPGQAPTVACAWIDEFHQELQHCSDTASFAQGHLAFARKRHAALGQAPVRRRAELLPLALGGKSEADARQAFASLVRDAAVRLHNQHHDTDPTSGHRVSFGLVRMANIEPLYDVALALYRLGAPEGMRIHLCVYHSQYPLLLRSAIERRLDAALDRRDEEAAFRLPDIREKLDIHGEPDQLFIVLGSPVTEVGRDHDYDWAVVEPSSIRSLIQLAGRVWRHRPLRECPSASPNLLVFDSNLRHWQNKDEAAFCRPGFEQDTGEFRLERHTLTDLLRADERDVIDSRPRIVPRADEALRPKASLVDLEHARLRRTMLPPRSEPPISTSPSASPAPPALATSRHRQRLGGPSGFRALAAAYHWWRLERVDALLTALLPQHQPFRADSLKRIELCLRPDEDGTGYALNYVAKQKYDLDLYVAIDRARHIRVPDTHVIGTRIAPWGQADYMEALAALAAEMDMPLDACAKVFGKVTVPENDRGWRFHVALGFAKRK